MKFLTLIIMLIGLGTVQSQSLKDVRRNFHQAVLDPGKSAPFYHYMKKGDNALAILKAYEAVSEAMLAQTLWNPISKLTHLMKFKKQINALVASDADNIEIRFLRLAIEYNLPRFLDMSDHLDEDRDVILANLQMLKTLGIDPGFLHYILYFLDDSGLCTDTQMEEMKAGLQGK